MAGFWIEMLVNHCTRLAKFDYICSAYHATLSLFWRPLVRYVIRTHCRARRRGLMTCQPSSRRIIFALIGSVGIICTRFKFDNFCAFRCAIAPSSVLRLLLLLDCRRLLVTLFQRLLLRLRWLLLVLRRGNVLLLLLLLLLLLMGSAILLLLSWNGLVVEVKELDFLNAS